MTNKFRFWKHCRNTIAHLS